MIKTANLGYPRKGSNRIVEKILDEYRCFQASRADLETAARDTRRENWLLQKSMGLDFIPSNDFSFHDHVLDTALMVGAIPNRYMQMQGDATETGLVMARNLPTSKWFGTNYDYIVPELSEQTSFRVLSTKVIDEYNEAKRLGVQTRPVLLGPVSFLLLSKIVDYRDMNAIQFLDRLLPVYQDIFQRLEDAGAEWVQIDEPCLSGHLIPGYRAEIERAYRLLGATCGKLKIMLTSYYASMGRNAAFVMMDLPVDGIHIDVVAAPQDLDSVVWDYDGEKLISLGVIDGRKAWITDLVATVKLVNSVLDFVPMDKLVLAPTCSLMHVPEDVEDEDYESQVKPWLAFAKQKLKELQILGAFYGKYEFEDKVHASTLIAMSNSILEDRSRSRKFMSRPFQEEIRDLLATHLQPV